MSNLHKTAKSVILMIILSLGSKLLGFIREVLIAAKFGSGLQTDTFFVALSATGIISTMIGVALKTTLIPIFSEIENKEGKSGKFKHTNNFLNTVVLISILLVCIGYIFAPVLVRILASGFKGSQFELAIRLTKIGLPILVFTGIISIFRGLLHSELMFFESSFSNFPFNFVYILFLIFLSGIYGIEGLMITSVLAVVSQITIQIPGVRKSGYKYKFIIDFNDKYLRKLFLLAMPMLIGTAINEINVIVDKTLASTLVSGSISALNYANRLNNLIIGVFISAITTVLFPMLSQESNRNIDSMKKIMKDGIRSILLIAIPATFGLILLAKPIVTVVFKRGSFDAIATEMTSQALIFYSIGLVAMSLRLFITRVYYSLQDTRTPMINGAISVVFNILLNLVLIRFMAHRGLALATSISTTILTTLLLYGLKKKLGNIGLRSYISCGAKSLIASCIMGLLSYKVYYRLYGVLGESNLYNLISLAVGIGVGVIVYVILCYVLGIEEVWAIVNKIRRRLIKK